MGELGKLPKPPVVCCSPEQATSQTDPAAPTDGSGDWMPKIQPLLPPKKVPEIGFLVSPAPTHYWLSDPSLSQVHLVGGKSLNFGKANV